MSRNLMKDTSLESGSQEGNLTVIDPGVKHSGSAAAPAFANAVHRLIDKPH